MTGRPRPRPTARNDVVSGARSQGLPQPWSPSFAGTGHLWPLLNGERGEQDLQTGDLDGASTMLLDMANFADGVGMIPEQDWEDPDVPPSP